MSANRSRTTTPISALYLERLALERGAREPVVVPVQFPVRREGLSAADRFLQQCGRQQDRDRATAVADLPPAAALGQKKMPIHNPATAGVAREESQERKALLDTYWRDTMVLAMLQSTLVMFPAPLRAALLGDGLDSAFAVVARLAPIPKTATALAGMLSDECVAREEIGWRERVERQELGRELYSASTTDGVLRLEEAVRTKIHLKETDEYEQLVRDKQREARAISGLIEALSALTSREETRRGELLSGAHSTFVTLLKDLEGRVRSCIENEEKADADQQSAFETAHLGIVPQEAVRRKELELEQQRHFMRSDLHQHLALAQEAAARYAIATTERRSRGAAVEESYAHLCCLRQNHWEVQKISTEERAERATLVTDEDRNREALATSFTAACERMITDLRRLAALVREEDADRKAHEFEQLNVAVSLWTRFQDHERHAAEQSESRIREALHTEEQAAFSTVETAQKLATALLHGFRRSFDTLHSSEQEARFGVDAEWQSDRMAVMQRHIRHRLALEHFSATRQDLVDLEARQRAVIVHEADAERPERRFLSTLLRSVAEAEEHARLAIEQNGRDELGNAHRRFAYVRDMQLYSEYHQQEAKQHEAMERVTIIREEGQRFSQLFSVFTRELCGLKLDEDLFEERRKQEEIRFAKLKELELEANAVLQRQLASAELPALFEVPVPPQPVSERSALRHAHVHVRTVDGTQHKVPVEPGWTLAELKGAVWQATNVPTWQQSLSLADGTALEEEEGSKEGVSLQERGLVGKRLLMEPVTLVDTHTTVVSMKGVDGADWRRLPEAVQQAKLAELRRQVAAQMGTDESDIDFVLSPGSIMVDICTKVKRACKDLKQQLKPESLPGLFLGVFKSVFDATLCVDVVAEHAGRFDEVMSRRYINLAEAEVETDSQQPTRDKRALLAELTRNGVSSSCLQQAEQITQDRLKQPDYGHMEEPALFSVVLHTTGAYSTINPSLRAGEFDRWPNYCYFHEKGLQQLPQQWRTVYRGLGKRVDPKQYAVGKFVSFGSITSTSLDISVTQGFGCLTVLEIETKTGRLVEGLSAFQSEKEVTLASGALFQVTRLEEEKEGKLHVFLKEFLPNEPMPCAVPSAELDGLRLALEERTRELNKAKKQSQDAAQRHQAVEQALNEEKNVAARREAQHAAVLCKLQSDIDAAAKKHQEAEATLQESLRQATERATALEKQEAERKKQVEIELELRRQRAAANQRAWEAVRCANKRLATLLPKQPPSAGCTCLASSRVHEIEQGIHLANEDLLRALSS